MSCRLLPGATTENWRAASPPWGTTTMTFAIVKETEKVQDEQKQDFNQFNVEEDSLVFKDFLNCMERLMDWHERI